MKNTRSRISRFSCTFSGLLSLLYSPSVRGVQHDYAWRTAIKNRKQCNRGVSRVAFHGVASLSQDRKPRGENLPDTASNRVNGSLDRIYHLYEDKVTAIHGQHP